MRMDAVWERIEDSVELLYAAGAAGLAFSNLFSDMATALKRHARCAGLQSADAEDVAADLIRKVIEKIDQYENRGTGSFRAWCLRIADNHLKNWFRDLPREFTVEESVWLTTPSRPASPENELPEFAPSPLQQKVWDLYSKLPEEQQTIVKWRAVDGLQFAEIADRLRIQTDTARQKFHRAKKKLESAGGSE
jgi:RNA polymerase sigma factor (sigma-70 family)